MNEPGDDDGMRGRRGTLCTSSIPNSSLSLCYGEREEDGENGGDV